MIVKFQLDDEQKVVRHMGHMQPLTEEYIFVVCQVEHIPCCGSILVLRHEFECAPSVKDEFCLESLPSKLGGQLKLALNLAILVTLTSEDKVHMWGMHYSPLMHASPEQMLVQWM